MAPTKKNAVQPPRGPASAKTHGTSPAAPQVVTPAPNTRSATPLAPASTTTADQTAALPKARKSHGAPKAKAQAAAAGNRLSTTPVLDQEALAKNRSTWAEEAQRFKALPTELLVPTKIELEQEAEMRKWRIGHAYLRFAGVGSVHSVVCLSDDPNDRHNPRALNQTHVANLGTRFSMTGGKQDRESPIYLKCSPVIIDPVCLVAMNSDARTISARDLDFSPPALRLVRPHGDLEDELETQLWFKQDQGSGEYHTNEQLAVKQSQLDDLRASRPRATLLNGNHRTSAMLAACAPIMELRNQIVNLDKAGEIAPEDLSVQLDNLLELVKGATYRCEVYREDTPQRVLAMLSENAPPRQALKAGRGERLWSIAEKIDGTIRQLKKEKGVSREDAINTAMEEVRQSHGSILQDAAQNEKPKKGKGKGRSRNAGETSVQLESEVDEVLESLLQRSTTLEMVMDTRHAFWVYSSKLQLSHAMAMGQDMGAAFAAHFWLGVRTLVDILHVANGHGLTDAETWARGTPLTVGGDRTAVEHWDRLHAGQRATPKWIHFYGAVESTAFGQVLEQARRPLRSKDGGIDWTLDEVVLASRGVFDKFAKTYDASKEEAGRWIAASLRLFARLPLWKQGDNGPMFYPAAALPSTTWMSAKATETNALQASVGSDAGIAAICLLEDPRTGAALAAFKPTFDKKYRLLNTKCVANKSGSAAYGIVPTLVARYDSRTGGEASTQSKLLAAKDAVLDWVFKDADTDMGAILAKHDVLTLVSPGFWDDFDIMRWCMGWNDQPSKQRGTVAAALGWGILSDEILYQIIQPVLDSPSPARWLLHLVRELKEVRGLPTWWGADQFCDVMPDPNAPEPPAPPPIEADCSSPPPLALEAPQVAPPIVPPVVPPVTRATAPTASSVPRPATPITPAPASRITPAPAPAPSASAAPGHPVWSSSPRTLPTPPPRTASNQRGPSFKLPPISRSIIASSEDEDEAGNAPKDADGDQDGDEDAGRDGDAQVAGPDAGPQPESDAEDQTEDGTEDVRAFTQRLLPPHVLHSPAWSDSMFQHLVGMHAFLRPTQPVDGRKDKACMQALQDSEALGLELNWQVSKERQRMRDTVVAIGAACTSTPYGSDLATFALPAIMGFIKDAYMVNLVKVFQSVPGVSLGIAVNEAMHIVTSDGLFEHDLATIDERTNRLQLDLSHTFALESQAKGKPQLSTLRHSRTHPFLSVPSLASCFRKVGNRALFDSGVLNGTLADRSHTFRVLDHFHPARGVGRTEAESQQRACDAMMLQGFKNAAHDNRPEKYVFLFRTAQAPPPPSSFPPVRVFDQASQFDALARQRDKLAKAS
ncbi:hypothetical protein FRC06_004270, partial [Ceratobasidium sp. 370]